MKALTQFVLVFALMGTVAASEPQWRWSGVERVVAFADVHGAYDELVGLLQTVEVIDDELQWTGGQTHLVSTGDLLDRGPHSRRVLDLLMRLQTEAESAGGRVHVLLGNHELMNLTSDLRYVSIEEYQAFEDEEPTGARDAAFRHFMSDTMLETSADARTEFDKIYPAGYFGLRAAFAPDGRYGRWLLDRPLLIVVNRTAFTHGGVPPLVASLGLQEINSQLRRELKDYVGTWQQMLDRDLIPVYTDAIQGEKLVEEKLLKIHAAETAPAESVKLLEDFDRLLKSDIFDDDGPLWYRGTALCHPILESPVIAAALSSLDVDRVVVGHTPTRNHRVTMRMDDRIILLDTGMLRHYYKGVPSALVIENQHARVVYSGDEPQDTEPNDHATLEQLLREASVAGRDDNLVVLREGERTIRAAFRSAGTDPGYRQEITAYRIDRMLGLGVVPVAVERTIDGDRGVLSLRHKTYIDEVQRRELGTNIPGWCAIGDEYDLMYVFDALVGNEGRTPESMLYFGSELSLRLTGFGKAFGTGSNFPAYLKKADVILPSALTQRLEALDTDNLGKQLEDLLSKRQIRALLKRRDKLLGTWPRTLIMDKAPDGT